MFLILKHPAIARSLRVLLIDFAKNRARLCEYHGSSCDTVPTILPCFDSVRLFKISRVARIAAVDEDSESEYFFLRTK